MAEYSEVLPIRNITSPNESLEQPIQDSDKKWRMTTIEVLPEDVLLEIFDFYRLDAMEQSQGRPWKWHRLAHVSRKWRGVVFRSPRRLGLKILCEYGAPIGSILASWPTLPLVANFNVGPKSKHIPRNVMVALRRPDRLCEIDLQVTSSMLASIVQVTQKPCRALESIRITVQAPTGPSILARNTFLGGSAPHLREIELDGIAFPFPSIQQVLLSTNNLVDLHLGHIPNDAYFSPNDLVAGLSTLLQLKRLTVDFHFLPSSPPPSLTRPPPRRTTLSSLMSLDFHGTSEYLEEFVAQIDLPALCKITIRLFNDIFFEIPEFCKFISRPNALKSPTQVIVKHSVDFIGIHFEEGKSSDENWFLGTSCRQFDGQVSFVTQITSQLPSHLSSVRSLDIQSGDEWPTGEEDMDATEWLELFQPFTHVNQVCVSEKLVPSIVPALVVEEMTAEVLPELTSLQLGGYRRSPSVVKDAEQFVTTRRLSGRTVSLDSDDTEQDREREREWQREWLRDRRREREQKWQRERDWKWQRERERKWQRKWKWKWQRERERKWQERMRRQREPERLRQEHEQLQQFDAIADDTLATLEGTAGVGADTAGAGAVVVGTTGAAALAVADWQQDGQQ